MDPVFTAGLCVISFCRASIFFAPKKHSDPRFVSPGSFTGGFWREDDWKMFLFFGRWFNLPYTTNIYPLPGRPFLSRFVFRTSRLVGYVICDRSLEVLWCFSPWKPRGSNCWCSSRSCQSPSELCGTTERCSVDVEEPGTIFVLCPLECWSLINKELKVVEIQLNTDLPIKISSQHFTRHWIL